MKRSLSAIALLVCLVVTVVGFLSAAESIIEDFSGTVPSSISAGSPARITFSGSGHGFTGIQAFTLLTVLSTGAGNVSNGDTLTIDGRAYTFKTTLTSCSAYDIKIGADYLTTTRNIYNAVNALVSNTQGPGVSYCTGTLAHTTSEASYWSSNILQIRYLTGGTAGNGKAVSFSSANLTLSRSTMQMMWTYLVTGATGTWFPLNTSWYGQAIVKDMTASGTTLRLSSCAALDIPSDHSATVIVGSEEMLPTATATVSNGCNVTVTRGANSTTAAAHEAGSIIGFNIRNSAHTGGASAFYVCQYVDSTHCDLYADTSTSSPIDTTGFGAFPGVVLWRGNWANTGGAEPLVTPYLGSSGSFAQYFSAVTIGGQTMLQVTVPPATGCTGTLDLDACALGFLTPDTQGAGVGITVISASGGLVVTSNSGKMVVTSCAQDGGGLSPPCNVSEPAFQPKVGGVVELWRMSNSSIDSTVGTGLNRPFIITGVFSDAGCTTPSTTSFSCITVDTTPYSLANGTYGAPGGQTAGFMPLTHQAPYIYLKHQVISGMYPYSVGSLRGAVKSGPLPTDANPYNRYRVNWRPATFVPRRTDGGTNLSAAGEWRNINDPGEEQYFGVGLNHWYHYGSPNFYANDWSMWEIVATPTHHVSAALSTINYPNDPTFQGSMEPQWTGHQAGQSPRHYFNALNAWYNNYGPVEVGGVDLGGSYLFDRPRFDTVAGGEPEEFAGNAYVTWTATRATSGNQGYEISFTTPRYVNATYDVKYSTSGSLKTAGFSTGTTFCSASATGSGYESAWCEGPTMAKASSIWIGIRPTMPLQACTGNGSHGAADSASPIWCMTEHDSDPMLPAGTTVTVTGVGGNTAANQTNATLAGVQGRKFWWAGDPQYVYAPNHADSDNVASFSDNGGAHLVKVTRTLHGLTTGDQVEVLTAGGNVNGIWTATVIDANNFTLDTTVYSTVCPSGCSSGEIRKFVNGGLTSVVSTGGGAGATCTATTSSAHGLASGWKIAVRNTSDVNLGQISDNVAGAGTPFYKVATVPTTTTLTFACPNVPSGTYKTDYSTSAMMVMEAWAAFALPGSGNGDYTSGGSVVSTDDNTGFREIMFSPPTGVATPTVTTASLPNGTAGSAYSQTLAATGGTPGYTWSQIAGTLPAGLTLHTATGVIDGTPSSAGTASGLQFRVTDSASQTADSSTMSLTVDPLPSGVSNVVVQNTTSTQAVITAHCGGACTIEVSESPTYSPLVYATDSSKGGSSAAKFNDGNGNYVFVVGKRTSSAAGYSLALQCNTQHFFRITDPSDSTTATGSFMTPTITPVVTGDDIPLLSPGVPAWPKWFDKSDQTAHVIDPLTGLYIRPAVVPGKVVDRVTGSLFDRADNVGSANWSNPNNILSTSTGTYATYTGSGSGTQGWMFVRNTQFDPPSAAAYGGFNQFFGAQGADINNITLHLKGSTSRPACGSSGDIRCKIDVCFAVNGVTCSTGILTKEISSTADTAINFCDADVQPGLHCWMQGASAPLSPPERPDITYRSGPGGTNGVRVGTDNQTVTWTGSDVASSRVAANSRFNQIWVPGSWIRLNATNTCQIGSVGKDLTGSVYSGKVLTLVDPACYTGPQNTTVAFDAGNSGFLIRKSSPDADTVSLNSASFDYTFSPDFLWGDGGLNNPCSLATVPGNAGLDQGYYCRFNTGGNFSALFWIDTLTGNVRFVGLMFGPSQTSGADTWNTIRFGGKNNLLHDNTHPGTFYGYFTTLQAGAKLAFFKIVLTDPTHAEALSQTVNGSAGRMTQDSNTSTCTYTAANWTQTCKMPNGVGTVTFQLLTPPSTGHSVTDMLQAFTTSDPIPFCQAGGSCAQAGFWPESVTTMLIENVQNGRIVFDIVATQNTAGWQAVLDVGDGNPANAGTTGPHIIAAKLSNRGAGCSWCTIHAAVNPGDVDYLLTGTATSGAFGFAGSVGAGPWRSQVTAVEGSACTTNCTLGTGAAGDTIHLTVDAAPRDPSPIGLETGNPGEWGDWSVGDYVCISTSSNAYCNIGSNELAQVTAYNPATHVLTLQRGHGSFNGTLPEPNSTTHAISSSAIYLYGSCMSQNTHGFGNGTTGGGYNAWDYLNDPHGLNPNYNVSTDPDAEGANLTIFKDRTNTGGHQTFRSNNKIFAHSANTNLCDNIGGSCTGIQTGDFPALYQQPETLISAGGLFNNVNGASVANPYQTHVTAGPAGKLTFYDANPMMGGLSSGTATRVSKNLYNLTTTCSSPCDVTSGNATLHRKVWPTVVGSGRYLMQDISGPASSITDLDVDAYKYCIARIDGECFAGSTHGDIYYNLPMIMTTTNACDSTSVTTQYMVVNGDDTTAFCISDSTMVNQSHLTEILAEIPADARSVKARNLTRGFSRYRMSYDFLNVAALDENWAIFTSPWNSGLGYQPMLAKLPPFMTDSVPRSNFVPRQVTAIAADVPASTVTAYVKFGYEENGAYSSFYCTARAESCAVGTNTWPGFSFVTTDTVTPKSCATGCTFNVPALPGRVGFAQIVFLDSGGVQTGTSAIKVFAVN